MFHSACAKFDDLATLMVYAAVRLWAFMQQAIAGIMTCYIQM